VPTTTPPARFSSICAHHHLCSCPGQSNRLLFAYHHPSCLVFDHLHPPPPLFMPRTTPPALFRPFAPTTTPPARFSTICAHQHHPPARFSTVCTNHHLRSCPGQPHRLFFRPFAPITTPPAPFLTISAHHQLRLWPGQPHRHPSCSPFDFRPRPPPFSTISAHHHHLRQRLRLLFADHPLRLPFRPFSLTTTTPSSRLCPGQVRWLSFRPTKDVCGHHHLLSAAFAHTT
jgi:hypothetical protein